MNGIQIATVVMSILSIVISGLSVYWSVKSRRIRQDIARVRTERHRDIP